MKHNTMKAIITGTNCEDEPFEEILFFEMVPPKEGEPHYGTGYYMTVRTPYQKHLIDVRYEHTTDIEILADRWIKNWYGNNAHKVVKQF